MPLAAISPPQKLPGEYEYRDMTQSSSSTLAFMEGIYQRDKFLGENRCVICGVGGVNVVQSCYLVAQGDTQTWLHLKHCDWIPSQAKDSPELEPRNCVLMCPNHRILFERGDFIIRYVPEARRFLFVKISEHPYHSSFHGKAIALAIDDHYAPFPALFIMHEIQVRQNSSFVTDIQLEVPDGGFPWQDWIVAEGLFDNDSKTFRRDYLPASGDADLHSAVSINLILVKSDRVTEEFTAQSTSG